MSLEHLLLTLVAYGIITSHSKHSLVVAVELDRQQQFTKRSGETTPAGTNRTSCNSCSSSLLSLLEDVDQDIIYANRTLDVDKIESTLNRHLSSLERALDDHSKGLNDSSEMLVRSLDNLAYNSGQPKANLTCEAIYSTLDRLEVEAVDVDKNVTLFFEGPSKVRRRLDAALSILSALIVKFKRQFDLIAGTRNELDLMEENYSNSVDDLTLGRHPGTFDLVEFDARQLRRLSRHLEGSIASQLAHGLELAKLRQLVASRLEQIETFLGEFESLRRPRAAQLFVGHLSSLIENTTTASVEDVMQLEAHLEGLLSGHQLSLNNSRESGHQLAELRQLVDSSAEREADERLAINELSRDIKSLQTRLERLSAKYNNSAILLAELRFSTDQLGLMGPGLVNLEELTRNWTIFNENTTRWLERELRVQERQLVEASARLQEELARGTAEFRNWSDLINLALTIDELLAKLRQINETGDQINKSLADDVISPLEIEMSNPLAGITGSAQLSWPSAMNSTRRVRGQQLAAARIQLAALKQDVQSLWSELEQARLQMNQTDERLNELTVAQQRQLHRRRRRRETTTTTSTTTTTTTAAAATTTTIDPTGGQMAPQGDEWPLGLFDRLDQLVEVQLGLSSLLSGHLRNVNNLVARFEAKRRDLIRLMEGAAGRYKRLAVSDQSQPQVSSSNEIDESSLGVATRNLLLALVTYNNQQTTATSTSTTQPTLGPELFGLMFANKSSERLAKRLSGELEAGKVAERLTRLAGVDMRQSMAGLRQKIDYARGLLAGVKLGRRFSNGPQMSGNLRGPQQSIKLKNPANLADCCSTYTAISFLLKLPSSSSPADEDGGEGGEDEEEHGDGLILFIGTPSSDLPDLAAPSLRLDSILAPEARRLAAAPSQWADFVRPLRGDSSNVPNGGPKDGTAADEGDRRASDEARRRSSMSSNPFGGSDGGPLESDLQPAPGGWQATVSQSLDLTVQPRPSEANGTTTGQGALGIESGGGSGNRWPARRQSAEYLAVELRKRRLAVVLSLGSRIVDEAVDDARLASGLLYRISIVRVGSLLTISVRSSQSSSSFTRSLSGPHTAFALDPLWSDIFVGGPPIGGWPAGYGQAEEVEEEDEDDGGGGGGAGDDEDKQLEDCSFRPAHSEPRPGINNSSPAAAAARGRLEEAAENKNGGRRKIEQEEATAPDDSTSESTTSSLAGRRWRPCRWPRGLKSRSGFSGQVDDLRLNEHKLGLWNTALVGPSPVATKSTFDSMELAAAAAEGPVDWPQLSEGGRKVVAEMKELAEGQACAPIDHGQDQDQQQLEGHSASQATGHHLGLMQIDDEPSSGAVVSFARPKSNISSSFVQVASGGPSDELDEIMLEDPGPDGSGPAGHSGAASSGHIRRLTIRFRTLQSNGLLLHHSRPDHSSFMSVYIWAGRLMLAVDFDKKLRIESHVVLSDGQWHSLHLVVRRQPMQQVRNHKPQAGRDPEALSGSENGTLRAALGLTGDLKTLFSPSLVHYSVRAILDDKYLYKDRFVVPLEQANLEQANLVPARRDHRQLAGGGQSNQLDESNTQSRPATSGALSGPPLQQHPSIDLVPSSNNNHSGSPPTTSSPPSAVTNPSATLMQRMNHSPDSSEPVRKVLYFGGVEDKYIPLLRNQQIPTNFHGCLADATINNIRLDFVLANKNQGVTMGQCLID